MTSRRGAVLAAIVLMSIFAIYYNSELISRTSTGSRYSIPLEDAKSQEISLTKIESLKADTIVKDSTVTI